MATAEILRGFVSSWGKSRFDMGGKRRVEKSGVLQLCNGNTVIMLCATHYYSSRAATIN